ncbi:bifunctional metallophosphatase/5'-nucleotidase [Vibrio superstes]|uniref:Bifunctional metallophosphatase/5'-nucleotidase n=1 Tax=Vibrio superstes NBRC 103154 TaxID=1219062 RepID=A0A511QM22_9VIBR|nr:5'-nucleotidase C-terminal domain-containing protein [Vibrio superstes]GEM78026.1 bifunctional metallophosphatase/5'-nucleotidase [Vibrio superstes NBRC 103154]
MNKKILAVAIVAGLVGCNSSNSDNDNQDRPIKQELKLSIAHINDTHSAFDEVKSSFVSDYLMQGKPVYTSFGGHPRLLEAANVYKEQAELEDRAMLFLHGGDAWQGSAYFKINKGQMNADILSQMGLDAMAMGNHEFDLDNATLAEFLNNINFPVLGANMDVSLDADLSDANNLLPYTLFAFDGSKKEQVTLDTMPMDKPVVAVVGMVLEDMPAISPETGDVEFHGEVETAQLIVNELQDSGVDKIVLLTHLGLARDVRIAENVDGIDVIVGGHSHTLMGDFTNLGMAENAEYAQIIETPNGGKTCIVQAGEKAQAIGHANVHFGLNGEIVSCEGGNTLLSSDIFYADNIRDEDSLLSTEQTDEVAGFIDDQDNINITNEDQDLRSHIDVIYKPALEEAYGATISYVPQDIIHERRPNDGGTDEHGSRVAPIVGEGWLQWANSDAVLSEIPYSSVDFALVGAGGVRNSLEVGDFREGHVSLELLPFSNYMSVMQVKGSVVRDLLTETITTSLKDDEHMGKFPYTGGLRYVFNEQVAQTSGSFEVLEVRNLTGEWVALSDSQTYTITTTNYNANGNDNWDALYEAQSDSADRYDLVIQGDTVVAYQVDRVEKNGDSLKAIYTNGEPNCDDSNVQCNTDAQAVIDYIAQEHPVLEELQEPQVTLNLLDR